LLPGSRALAAPDSRTLPAPLPRGLDCRDTGVVSPVAQPPCREWREFRDVWMAGGRWFAGEESWLRVERCEPWWLSTYALLTTMAPLGAEVPPGLLHENLWAGGLAVQLGLSPLSPGLSPLSVLALPLALPCSATKPPLLLRLATQERSQRPGERRSPSESVEPWPIEPVREIEKERLTPSDLRARRIQ